MMNSNDAWLTSEEASQYLKVQRRTLLAWVRAGAIPAYRLHGTKRTVWRFRRQDLDEHLLTAQVVPGVLHSPQPSVARVQ